MIILSEQYGYKSPKPINNIGLYADLLKKQSYKKSIQRGENKAYCYDISYTEEDNNYYFETSYFVGVDWIVENELSIYVKPKLDDDFSEVNYVKMLFDILKEPENYNHLDQLCEIDFNKPAITIEQRQDLLSPFLIIQYINILKKIVQKGLKKSYYTVTQNLNSKIKGKILINETIKKNHHNNKQIFNYCKYTEFGINSLENRILKRALMFSISAIHNLKGIDTSKLNESLNYIYPSFVNVDDEVNIEELRTIKHNKLYKEYEQALRYATYILKRYSYNISAVNSINIKTPPFWIDMSKLFELYVFSKLREKFRQHTEVTYHRKFNYLEPDFIIKANDGSVKMIVDAKYKPQYKDNSISIEDIRQISGYARLNKIYDFLDIKEDKIIDCLVIYSNQKSNRKDFLNDNFNELDKEANYKRFYKMGIQLPIQCDVHSY
ncbi:MAG: 5-methylcytosine restriction system specificity protein McrC [Bacteroidales bacterium]